MAERLADLNTELRHELPQTLRLGIGVHVGHAIVGDMGYGKTIGLTAIGDVVNTASRLESSTKDYHATLVISAEVAELAELDTRNLSRHRMMVRGRDQEMEILAIGDPTRLQFAEERRRRPRNRWLPVAADQAPADAP